MSDPRIARNDPAITGRRATVMGLGRHGGGVAAVRYLCELGSRVTVCDLADEVALAGPLSELADLDLVAVRLGPHREEDLCDTDMLVVNPAVRLGHPLVERARARGVWITSEIELFLNHCPAPVIGVTGTCGKSTTAAMLADILSADGRRTYLGGNLGGSLLPRLAELAADDWVVLELSSFQLAWLSPTARLPEFAVVTNCSPNHLDWHDDYADYVAAKQRLLGRERENKQCVLGSWDEVQQWHTRAHGEVLSPVPLKMLPPLRVLGEHNARNAACAAAAALAAGCRPSAVEAGLREFSGLPQRLQSIGSISERMFVDDSQATTPESTVAALEAMQGDVWLLAGGADKGADWFSLATAIVGRARGVALYGNTAAAIAAEIRAQLPEFPLACFPTLELALGWCWNASRPGDTILLSPACASFDQYADCAARSADLAICVEQLSRRHGVPETSRHLV